MIEMECPVFCSVIYYIVNKKRYRPIHVKPQKYCSVIFFNILFVSHENPFICFFIYFIFIILFLFFLYYWPLYYFENEFQINLSHTSLLALYTKFCALFWHARTCRFSFRSLSWTFVFLQIFEPAEQLRAQTMPWDTPATTLPVSCVSVYPASVYSLSIYSVSVYTVSVYAVSDNCVS